MHGVARLSSALHKHKGLHAWSITNVIVASPPSKRSTPPNTENDQDFENRELYRRKQFEQQFLLAAFLCCERIVFISLICTLLKKPLIVRNRKFEAFQDTLLLWKESESTFDDSTKG